jgi:hypothetical protein
MGELVCSQQCPQSIACLPIQKEYIKSYNWFQKNCTTKNMPFFCESTCSLDELDEKRNHTKTSKFGNFKGKGCKANDSFF